MLYEALQRSEVPIHPCSKWFCVRILCQELGTPFLKKSSSEGYLLPTIIRPEARVMKRRCSLKGHCSLAWEQQISQWAQSHQEKGAGSEAAATVSGRRLPDEGTRAHSPSPAGCAAPPTSAQAHPAPLGP